VDIQDDPSPVVELESFDGKVNLGPDFATLPGREHHSVSREQSGEVGPEHSLEPFVQPLGPPVVFGVINLIGAMENNDPAVKEIGGDVNLAQPHCQIDGGAGRSRRPGGKR